MWRDLCECLGFKYIVDPMVALFRKFKQRSAYKYSNGAMIHGKMWVNNWLLPIKKIARKNKRYDDLGFIPSDWKLVRYDDGKEVVLAYGVADFDLVEEDGKTVVVYTNGKSVYKLWEEDTGVEKERLFKTTRCVKVCARAK